MAMWGEQPNNYNDRRQVNLNQPTYSMKNRNPPMGKSSAANGKNQIVIGNTSDSLQERFKDLAGNKGYALFLKELLDIYENFEGK